MRVVRVDGFVLCQGLQGCWQFNTSDGWVHHGLGKQPPGRRDRGRSGGLAGCSKRAQGITADRTCWTTVTGIARTQTPIPKLEPRRRRNPRPWLRFVRCHQSKATYPCRSRREPRESRCLGHNDHSFRSAKARYSVWPVRMHPTVLAGSRNSHGSCHRTRIQCVLFAWQADGCGRSFFAIGPKRQFCARAACKGIRALAPAWTIDREGLTDSQESGFRVRGRVEFAEEESTNERRRIDGRQRKSGTCAGGNQKRRVHSGIGRNAQEVGCQRAAFRGLGTISPQRLAGGSQSDLCVAILELVRPDDSTIG